MQTRVRALGVGLLVAWAFAGATALGCGDEQSANGGAPDAAGDGDGLDASSGTVASAADVVVYTGTLASLDASSSTGSGFAWTVKAVPAGSKIVTASLQGATTARPSFVPDVSGDYDLDVTVTAGTATAVKTVRVRAVPAPVFYTLTNIGENPPYYEVRTVGMDGTGAHAVTCRQQLPTDGGDAGDTTAGFLFMAFVQADIGLDWWEAPPGQPSRAAFQDYRFGLDGGSLTLAVGTTDSTCQSPPTVVRAISAFGGDGGSQNTPGIFQPHFSPDGQRIAYIEQRPEGHFIAVVGYDGKDYREIGPVCPVVGQSCWKGDVLLPPRPQWLDNQTIAWARTTATAVNGNGWEIVQASDSANPSPSLYMSCDGLLPLGFTFLKDGSVLANRHPVGGAQDLWVMKPGTPGGTCQILHNLTSLPNTKSYARDFSVSPDGNTVAFLRHVEPDAGDAGLITFGGELYTAPTNGAAAAAPMSSPADQAFFGPRYIAQGAFLSYNGVAPLPAGALQEAGIEGGAGGVFDGGMPAINVVPAGGGPITQAAASNVAGRTFVLGGGNGGGCGFGGCAVAASGANVAGGAVSVLLGGLLLVRRRRRAR